MMSWGWCGGEKNSDGIPTSVWLFRCDLQWSLVSHPWGTHPADLRFTEGTHQVSDWAHTPSLHTYSLSLTRWGVGLMSFPVPLPVISKRAYDHVVEEHFQRSLGLDYQKARSQLSISVSVDDHFAKALGDKWLQIKSKSSSCSSTPPSSPSVTHSPTYSQNHSHKETSSSSSPNCSHWPVN